MVYEKEQRSGKEDYEIFTKLYKTEYEGLLRYACAILKGRSNGNPVKGRAEEAVQEMFVFAWERRDELLSSEKPVGWLYNSLHYKVLELIREENKWTKRLLFLEDHETEKNEPHVSLNVELEGIISKEEYDLLKRIYMDGYSYKELCEELHMNKSALGMKIKRIKEKILKNIE